MVLLRFFMVFCISTLFAYVGFRPSFFEPLGSLWEPFSLHFGSKLGSWAVLRLPSRPPGGPFGLQVGVLEGLEASKLASLAAWASKLASWVSFAPPSWPRVGSWPPNCLPGPAFGSQVGIRPGPIVGLQVGIWVWLWASKLASD